jgi:hypothetical protein
MERLTTWNGSKYILPQGRTPDGESYWRIIADKLAEYENREPTESEIRYGFTDIMMPVETRNVERLARIYNNICEDAVHYWLTEPDWAERFESRNIDHWMIEDLRGKATAFYHMNMLTSAHQASARFIYDSIKAEVERRKGVSK